MKILSLLSRVFLVFFIHLATNVHAQTASVMYEVENVLSGETFKERWTATRESGNPNILQTEKVTQVESPSTVQEKSMANPNWWIRVTRPQGEKEYYEEFLATPPFFLEPGETSFGYVNIRNASTNEITESWPLFVSVEKKNVMKMVLFTLFISNNRIMEVSRFYTGNMYTFPWVQQVKIYKPGIDPKTVPLVGVREHYFETFVVTSVAKQK